MNRDFRSAVLIGFLVGGWWFGLGTIAAGEEKAGSTDSPTTLEEGLARVEKVLGRHNPDDQLEWRVPTDFEHKTRPNSTEPEILMVFKGLKVVSHPFREPESFSFDEIWRGGPDVALNVWVTQEQEGLPG